MYTNILYGTEFCGMYGWSTVVRCVQYVLRTDGMIPLPHTGIARPGWSLSCWSLTLTSTLHCIRIRIRPSAPRNLLYYTVQYIQRTMKLICHRIDRPAMAVPCLLLSTHIPDHYPWRAINSQSPPITSISPHFPGDDDTPPGYPESETWQLPG